MESKENPAIGTRLCRFVSTFKDAIRCLLTMCSKEEFVEAFQGFNNVDVEKFHRIYIEVVSSLYKNLEEEFESLCETYQVKTALDTLDVIEEEQRLNLLFLPKNKEPDVSSAVSLVKKNEEKYLMEALQRIEEHNRLLQTQIDCLEADVKLK